MESKKPIFFDNIAILGVGLLGASLALVLKENNLCNSIIGYGRTEENLKRAAESGIVDRYCTNLKETCLNADLVVLATPVGSFKDIVNSIREHLKEGCLVTDVGSVKGRLVYEIEAEMPEGVYYIGSHPIAGSDKSGIDNARSDLFKSALCIITPTENSDTEAIKKIALLWEAIGADVKFMDPYKHDEIYAAISHLPHIIAYTLVNTIDDIDSDFIEYAGQGFKDTTRIALSSPEMWRDISIFNRENLIRMTGVFRENLDKIEELLTDSDARGIEKEFLRAQKLRKRLG